MNDKTIDVVALGSCYVDTNLEDYPFKDTGISAESELVGGRYEVTLGGSAVNFCSLLQTLGLQTTFVGMAGMDPNGDLLETLLKKQGIQPALIRREGILTNIGFNMTNSGGKHIMLVGGTASAALSPEAVIPTIEKIIPAARMLYLGGYFKLKNLTSAFIEIMDYAKQVGTEVILDHGRIPEGTSDDMLDTLRQLAQKATYYFPSRNEFCAVWEVNAIEDGLQLLGQQAPDLVTVVKDGENGAFYLVDGQVKHAEAIKVSKVLNATGAGDSFNAGIMAALNEGYTLTDAIPYGCRVAAARIKAETPPLID